MENVLRAPSGRWVLCDFGSCSSRHGVLQSARDIALEEEVVRKYATPAYRAPEVCVCVCCVNRAGQRAMRPLSCICTCMRMHEHMCALQAAGGWAASLD